MQHDERRSGTLNRELLTELVGMLPGALGQHEGARFSQENRACVQRSQRSMEPRERALGATWDVRDRSRLGERLVQHLVFGARRVEEATKPSTSNWNHSASFVFTESDVDRSGRQRTAASLTSSLERELEGPE